MLIDHPLRDRIVSIQNSQNDIGLFGATTGTFQSWSGAAGGAMEIGPVTGASGMAQSIAVASMPVMAGDNASPFGTRDFHLDSESALSGTLQTPGTAISATLFVNPAIATAAPVAGTPSDTAYQTAIGGSGSAVLAIQMAHQDDTSQSVNTATIATDTAAIASTGANIVAATDAAATSTAVMIDGVAGATAANVAVIASEIEAAIAQARADAFDQIDQITQSATAQVAAIQSQLAESIVNTGQQVSSLTQSVGDGLLHVSAPALDAVEALPGSIGAQIDVDLAAGLDTAVALGDTQIGLAQDIAVSADLALDLAQPIVGNDVSGGITTLVGMVSEGTGFVVEDTTAGIAWPVAAVTPLDSIDDLIAPVDTLVHTADIEPSSVLLGIADPGHLLDGLPDHHDLGIG